MFYRRRYRESSITGIASDNRKGRPCHLSLDQHICLSTGEVIAFIEQHFSISYSVSGGRQRMNINGAINTQNMVLDVALQIVQQFQEVWQKEKKHLPLSKQVILAINHHLKRVPLVREMAAI